MADSKDNNIDREGKYTGVNLDDDAYIDKSYNINEKDDLKNVNNNHNDIDSTSLNEDLDGRKEYSNLKSASKSKLDESIQDTKETVSRIKGKIEKDKFVPEGAADILGLYNDVKAERENEKIGYTKDRNNRMDKLTDKVKKFTNTETEGSYDNKYTVRNIKLNLAKMLTKAYFTTSGKIKLFWAFLTSGLGLTMFGAILSLLLLILASVLLVCGVAILMLTGDKGGDNGDSNIGDGSGEEVPSASVDVPKGLEGKFMLPLDDEAMKGGVLYTAGIGGYGGHIGWDLSGMNGSLPWSNAGKYKVYPIYPGQVIYAKKGDRSCLSSQGAWGGTCASLGRGWGNDIVIKSKIDGKFYYHLYGHLHEGTIKVSTGDKVGFGTELGRMGNTGFSSGTHLHVEMRNNIKEDLKTGQEYANRHTGVASDYLSVPTLITCGGKSGVLPNHGPGYTASKFPEACYKDASKSRK